MKQDLIDAMYNMDVAEFKELESSIAVASYTRLMMIKHNATKEFVQEKLKIHPEELQAILNGCYPFDLRMMSKIEALNVELDLKKAEADSNPVVSFPPYKDTQVTIGDTVQ